MSRHFDDLDAILEFDSCNDLWQLVALQSPPCFRGGVDEFEGHELGGLRRQGSLCPHGSMTHRCEHASIGFDIAVVPEKYRLEATTRTSATDGDSCCGLRWPAIRRQSAWRSRLSRPFRGRRRRPIWCATMMAHTARYSRAGLRAMGNPRQRRNIGPGRHGRTHMRND